MRREDLEPLNDVPFFFWVKDAEGTYLWGNRAMAEFAGEDVAGKTDADLESAETAEALRRHDREVLEKGEPEFVHELVDGLGNLSVCKWAGDLDGQTAAFGVSFLVKD